MASKKAGRITILILRLFVFIFLLVSLIILATDTVTVDPDPDNLTNNIKIRFKDSYAYRYVLSVAVIGCVYTLSQVPLAATNVISEKSNEGGNNISQFFLYTDLVFSLLFATAVGAGFGFTVDSKSDFDKTMRRAGAQDTTVASDVDKFFDLVHVSTGFLLIATVYMAAITITSMHTLNKK